MGEYLQFGDLHKQEASGEPKSIQPNFKEVVASGTVGSHMDILMMPNEE
jgi:hypothetical protein